MNWDSVLEIAVPAVSLLVGAVLYIIFKDSPRPGHYGSGYMSRRSMSRRRRRG